MAGRRGQCRPPYGWLFGMVRIRRGSGGMGRWYRVTVMTVSYGGVGSSTFSPKMVVVLVRTAERS